MSELQVGDVVSYKGNRGIVRKVFHDEKETFYRIDVTITSIRYLYQDELDLVVDQPTLNGNQIIMLEWLKYFYLRTKYQSFFGCVDYIANHHSLFIKSRLSNKQQAQVLQVFSGCVLEQETE